MSRLWGKRHNDDGGEEARNQDQPSARDSGEINADERTRLLPPREGQGYLRPDDPAVSISIAILLWFTSCVTDDRSLRYHPIICGVSDYSETSPCSF